ncbi:unnamed protein product [Caenorhabditis nigoni]
MSNGNGNDPEYKLEYNDISLNELFADDKMRRMVVDLQRHWLTEYHQSRQKGLEDLTKMLHEEFRLDTDKVRQDLMAQFKQELDATKVDLEQKHEEILQQEIAKLVEKQKKELAAAKKKQWCWNCDKEAMYHCCWNTAYCSVNCQQTHWQNHRKFCRRKKPSNGAPARATAPAAVVSSNENME